MIRMFKIGFGLTLLLAVLKMMSVINCSWLMVLFPVLAVAVIFVVICVFTALGIYFLGQKEDKKTVRRVKR